MPIILDGNGIIKNINFQHPSASATNLSLNSDGTIAGAIPYPNRNLLYNGAMQLSQRGTSTASITTGGYYTADRWYKDVVSLGTWTQSVENDAPTGSGFRKSLKMLCTTADASPAAGDYSNIHQRLEGQDLQRIAKGTSSAQQLTMSFWVKSNVTGTYICELFDSDNTRSVSASYTISASATWEKKTITFPADTTGAFDNDNAASLYVLWWLGAGTTFTSGTLATTWASATTANRAVGQTNLGAATNNYWQITGVQLETGSIATPFEFKNYGQELRECQRYYIRQTRTSSSTTDVTGAFAPASSWTSAWQAYLVFPVTMRSVPILGSSATSTFCIHTGGVATSTISSIGASQATVDGARLGGASNYASTSGFGGQLCAYNATAFLEFSAEL